MPYHPNATIRGTDPSAISHLSSPARSASAIGRTAASIPLSPISDLRSPAPSASAIRPQSSVLGRFAAFTLIELLVVITIIGILAAITLAALGGVQEKTARDRTRAEITAISNALEQYRNIRDTYPPSGSANLFTNIAPFFETQNSQTNESGVLIDPYGNPYLYTMPGTRNPATFDVWSTGKNTSIPNDDIGNW